MEFSHTPWFICPVPTPDGQAVIENGTEAGRHIAVCEWHIAEEIVKAMNFMHQAPDETGREIERLRKIEADPRAYANVELSEENDRLIDEAKMLRETIRICAVGIYELSANTVTEAEIKRVVVERIRLHSL